MTRIYTYEIIDSPDEDAEWKRNKVVELALGDLQAYRKGLGVDCPIYYDIQETGPHGVVVLCLCQEDVGRATTFSP